MSQFIIAGYKTYGAKSGYGNWLPGFNDMLLKFTGEDGYSNEFYNHANANRNQYTVQLKLWKPMGYKIKDTYDYAKAEVDFLTRCQKFAFLDWRSLLEPLQKQLLENHKKVHVCYLGQEFLFSQSAGWRLQRYGSIKVLKRMWTILESEIHNELRNFSYKPPFGTIYEPRGVKIHRNIFVQFVFHSFGLLFGLLVFIVEFHKRINLFLKPVRVVFSFLFGNFLQQTRNACLKGLKILVREKNYFFDEQRE